MSSSKTVLALLGIGSLVVPSAAIAQITPDGSLGAEQSQVTPNVLIRDELGDRIDGGAVRNTLLFHSFEDFNVGDGQRVYFANPAGIESILSRVTGTDISDILGTLGVDGDANLFFLNPNGIIFGDNARLDVSGSFLATTADRFTFPDGSEFSAVDPGAPPLLTVTAPIGLQFGNAPGAIQNQGFLVMAIGQPLTFAGGDIGFDGGQVFTLGGQLELAAIGGEGLVLWNEGDRLTIPADIKRGDIVLTNNAQASSRAAGGGDVIATAENLSLLNGSALRTGFFEGFGDAATEGGDIVVDATELVSVLDGSGISNLLEAGARGINGDIVMNVGSLTMAGEAFINTGLNESAEGQVGDVMINATGAVTIRDDSFVRANNFRGTGDAGTIAITSGSLLAENDSGILALVSVDTDANGGGGNAGSIQIRTGAMRIANNTFVEAGVFNQGGSEASNAGQVTIQADAIQLEADSAISASSEQGSGGEITIQAAQLAVNDSQIFSVSNGGGASGNIVLDVEGRIDVAGETANISSVARNDSDAGKITITSDRLVLRENGSILAAGTGTGNGGDITIEANRVRVLSGGDIFAATDEAGRGGDITIQATDLVEVAGFSAISVPEGFGLPTRAPIASLISAGNTGNGEAGNITINTRRLLVQDGGTIGVGSIDQGSSGNITINASESVEVIGTTGIIEGFEEYAETIGFVEGVIVPSSLLTRTPNAEDAGNIVINTQRLAVRDGGEISADTSGEGRGGRIEINATESVIVSGTTEEFSIINDSGNFIRGSVPSFIEVDASGVGDAGELEINTGRLVVEGGGAITANTAAEGRGGILTINASDSVEVVGSQTGSESSTVGRIVSNITSGTAGDGDAGELTITTERLSVRDLGLILVNTSGAGNAGRLRIHASGEVSVSGRLQEDGEITRRSQIATNVNPNASGLGGRLELNVGSLSISEGGALNANTLGTGDAGQINIRVDDSISLNRGLIQTSVAAGAVGAPGDITVEGRSLTLRNGGQISAGALSSTDDRPGGRGTGGNIRITIEDSVDIAGVSPRGFSSGIFTSTETGARGRGGNIDVDASTVRLVDGGAFAARTANQSRGGNITVDAETLNLQRGGQIFVTALDAGNAGDITLNVSEEIRISGRDAGFAERLRQFGPNVVTQTGANSGLFANTTAESAGTGGNIRVSTNQLTISDEGAIAVSSEGTGNAGGVRIRANDVDLENSGSIVAETISSTGGDIHLLGLDTLRLDNSLISASTQTGRGGSVEIEASDVLLSDRSEISVAAQGSEAMEAPVTSSQRNARAIAPPSPTAGNLSILADRVQVSDSLISVSSPAGRAGALTISADALQLNAGELSAIAGESGDEGSALIQLDSLELLVLLNESLISADALNEADGGNISIDAADGFIISVLNQNNDIIANADQGRGGNISIVTQGLFGIEPRDAISPLSDITASSNIGLSGTIIIDTPDVEPERGTVELPGNLVDVSQLVAEACPSGQFASEELGRFVVTGLGGLPPSYGDVVDSTDILTEWVTSEESRQVASTVSLQADEESAPIEAQGWITTEEGAIALIATVPETTNPSLSTRQCP